ncbi:MAG: hypothetical protein WBF42_15650 [Terracidiphilus sp.]
MNEKHDTSNLTHTGDLRAAQARAFRRNQALALVALAAAVCLWWLFHTNPRWILPAGWWRL